jgi:DNA-binding response OmpR family regulator
LLRTFSHGTIVLAMQKFLIVDDHAPFRNALGRSLRPFGSVGHAATCADGREMIAREPWTALFIDVSLPDGSGLDLLAHARTTGCTTPTLVLSVRRDAHTIRRAVDLAADIIVKPGEWQQIDTFVRRALEAEAERSRAR